MTPNPVSNDGATLTAARPASTSTFDAAQSDFSIMLGGPLFQLMRGLHLSGNALELTRKRILFIVGLVWLPLLGLSAYEGQTWGGEVAVPFLHDAEAHIRFLLALPLLIAAEPIVHERMRLVVRQFLTRNLIPESSLSRFEAAIDSSVRMRNSIAAEVALLAIVYVVGILFIWRHFSALSTSATWYATPADGRLHLSLTGVWYASVSLPMYQFLLIRWYYRILIWVRFLWRVSGIKLNLIPTHPDRVGGLGALGSVTYGFMPLAIAHGAMLSALIANRIFYRGATLPQFKVEAFMLVLFVMALVFGPFLVFAPQLAAAKRKGLGEYGALAVRYVREFDGKWVRGGASPDEPLIGSGDIQSLADLANSYDVVKTMRLAPVTRDAALLLAAATLAPVVPLALTMMSFEDLMQTLFGVLF